MNYYENHNGFTLIELSIVLVLIGLLVGLGAGMIGPLTTAVKVRETRGIQDAAVQSVTSWASSNNTIPNGAGFPGVAKSPLDAWDRPFIYLYDANLYSATPTKDTLCGRRSTALTLVTTDPAATMTNVAFVVLSGADNATLKSTFNGSLNGTPVNNGVIAGSGAASGTITATGPNGDLIRWVTIDELRSKIGCQGAPLRIVNNELPFGSATNSYSATITADGGVPFGTNPSTYKFCVNNLPSGFSIQGSTGFFNADCLNASVATWTAATASSGVIITFAANAVTTNTYPVTVVVRDTANTGTTDLCSSAGSGDNCAQKLFVLTVNPQ